jgi:PAS domain S-box-containing protein
MADHAEPHKQAKSLTIGELQAALQESERRYTTLLANLPGMVYRCDNDPNWTMRFVSEGCKELTGYAPEDLVEDTITSWGALMAPAYREPIWNEWQRLLSVHGVFRGEYPITCRDGSIKWVWEQGRGIFAPDGRLVALEGFVQDITDKHEETLRAQESEARYRGLFEDAPVAFWEEDFSTALTTVRGLTQRDIMDVEEWLCAHPNELAGIIESVRVLDINSAAQRLYGATDKADVIGSLGRTMPREAYQRFIAQVKSLADGITTFSWEGPAGAESKPIYVAMQVSALPGHEQSCDRVLMSMLDITERREAEQKLLESERKYRELAESLPEVVFETDTNGRLLFANRNGLAMFGFESEDLARGVDAIELLIPEDRDRAKVAMGLIFKEGGPHGGEYTALRRDGSTFPVIIHSSSVVHDGVLAGMRGIMVDMTEQLRVDEQLRRVDKLESLGVLAGGIAHDFNNILTGIVGNINLARLEEDREKSRNLLIEAERAAMEARTLSQQLLAFAKGGIPVRASENILPVVEESVGFALRGSRARATFDMAPDLWMAVVDKGQIGQVVSNIVINADEAMPQGGTVAIRARNAPLQEDDVAGLRAGRYVRIDISDTGIGIPEANLAKIFDPYFSTKKRGSGLGLAMAYTIMQRHGGLVSVDSVLGQGTTFTLYVPASSEESMPQVPQTAPFTAGHGRVLVMDDELSIREVATAMLHRLGYDAESASDGESAVEAVTLATREHRPFDFLILDLTIAGGMGGQEALAVLRSQGCTAIAIASSGYSTDAVMADHKAHLFDGILVKPYNMEDLATAIAKSRTS